MNSRVAFFIAIGALFFSAIFPAIFVFVVDPFHIFHKASIKAHGFDRDNMFYMAAGILDNYLPDPAEGFDSVVIGSSTSVNYTDAMFKKNLGWQRTANLSISGSNPAHHQIILQKVLKIPSIKHVFIELSYHYSFDDAGNSLQPFFHKDDLLPYYLYDDSFINNFNYLFNANNFYESILISSGFLDKYGMSIEAPGSWGSIKQVHDILNTRKTYQYINEKKNAISSTPALLIEKQDFSFSFSAVDFRLFRVLMPYCNSGIDFVINFAIRPAEEWRSDVGAERELYVRRYVMEQASACKNIRVYAQENYEKLVSNPANFLDNAHYSPELNGVILTMIAKDESRLDPDNILQYEKQAIKNVHNQPAYLDSLLKGRFAPVEGLSR